MKVLLVDDHPLILSALTAVIHGLDRGIEVVGVLDAGRANAELAAADDFDLVLLDLSLGDTDGFEVLADLRSRYPLLPVVVVSATERHSDMIRAIDMGAMGFVPKRTSNRELVDALAMVTTGGVYLPPAMLGMLSRPVAASELRAGAGATPSIAELASAEVHQRPASVESLGLTPRQSDVMALLLKGLPNKLIARELKLSVETVKDHVAAVLRALGVSSRTQAVLAVSQMNQSGGAAPTPTPPRP
ncbi:response regulator transcription factor [Ideonella sp. A 288]|uniref:response regulator n=1 Tax=Ideonella sp. A 288 TaxID=1962181 RepID=UPI000B4AA4CA|nr:response regulator transcription factor [Ideonella sp. A 288]